MEKNNEQFFLNFVIPKGETGDIGPVGPSGKKGIDGILGPINSEEPIIFVSYYPKNENGMLEISNVNIIPQNTQVFEKKENFISLKKKGYYEFTLSGVLLEETKGNNTTFILRTQHQSNYNNYINVRLQNNEKRKYFVRQGLKRFSYLQDISLILNKSDLSNAIAEDVVLIIRKFL